MIFKLNFFNFKNKYVNLILKTKKFVFYVQVIITLLKIEASVSFWTSPKFSTIIHTNINFIRANLWRVSSHWAKVVGAFATVACQSNIRINGYRTFLTFMTKITKYWKCLTIFTIYICVIYTKVENGMNST